MEKELKELLKNIIENEVAKKQAIEEAKSNVENSKKREAMALERFEDKFNEDINAGLYNFTDGQIKRELDNGKAKISEEFQAEQQALEAKVAELEQVEDNSESNNSKIVLALRKYRDELMQKQYKIQKEVKKTEDRANIVEEQKMQELGELGKQINEKQARYTQLIMKNRSVMNVQNEDIGDITILSRELEELKLQKGEIITKYQEQLDTINNTKQELISQIDEFDTKIDTANQFFGKVAVKEKTPKEIYDILFKEQREKETEVEEKPEEVVNKEKVVNEEVVPEQQNVEEVFEEETAKEEIVEVEKDVVPENTGLEEKETYEFIIEEMPEKKATKIEVPVEKNTQKIVAEKENVEEKEEPVLEEDKKFSYEFSIKGIKYDEARIRNNHLLNWYEDYKDDIESAIQSAIGDKERIDEFIECADKLVYLSIMSKDIIPSSNGRIKVGSLATKRLEEYYKIWDNPNSKEESNMKITYNLKGISALSSIFGTKPFTREDIKAIKDNAYLLRNRENVKIENMGKFTALEFKLKEWKEKMQAAKNTKALGDGNKESKAGKFANGKEKSENFRQILREHAKQAPENDVLVDNVIEDNVQNNDEAR